MGKEQPGDNHFFLLSQADQQVSGQKGARVTHPSTQLLLSLLIKNHYLGSFPPPCVKEFKQVLKTSVRGSWFPTQFSAKGFPRW